MPVPYTRERFAMAKNFSFLITGAGGFVGACLTRRLLREGHSVHVIIRRETDMWRLKDIEGQLNIFRGDLTDSHFVTEAVQEIQPRVIYHLAAHGAYPTQNDAEKIITTNVLGTWNLLQACSSIDYEVFVNTGSSSEYGFKNAPMKEEDVLEPNSYYAVAKSAQTLLCQHVGRSQKKPICTFRLFSVYGYYEEATRLIPTLVRACLRGEKLEMVSPTTARDFVFVEDVLDAYLCLDRLKNLRGDILNIGTGRQRSLKEVVEEGIALTGANIEVTWGTMAPRIWDASVWLADIEKSKRLLNWEAKFSLREGLGKTIEWFKREQEKELKIQNEKLKIKESFNF